MKSWGGISAGLIPALIFGFRWLLLKTDVFASYAWKWEGFTNFYPSFALRNHSGSKTYVLGNIAYTKNEGRDILGFDNKSIWGKELKPGTITYLEATPVPSISSIQQSTTIEVTIRLQNGRAFRAQGPGQLYKGIRRFAFSLRKKIDKAAIPMPS